MVKGACGFCKSTICKLIPSALSEPEFKAKNRPGSVHQEIIWAGHFVHEYTITIIPSMSRWQGKQSADLSLQVNPVNSRRFFVITYRLIARLAHPETRINHCPTDNRRLLIVLRCHSPLSSFITSTLSVRVFGHFPAELYKQCYYLPVTIPDYHRLYRSLIQAPVAAHPDPTTHRCKSRNTFSLILQISQPLSIMRPANNLSNLGSR